MQVVSGARAERTAGTAIAIRRRYPGTRADHQAADRNGEGQRQAQRQPETYDLLRKPRPEHDMFLHKGPGRTPEGPAGRRMQRRWLSGAPPLPPIFKNP